MSDEHKNQDTHEEEWECVVEGGEQNDIISVEFDMEARIGEARIELPATPSEPNLWTDSTVQFPRLLAEILAIGLESEQYNALCETMDLEIGDIDEIFERADRLWEIQKGIMRAELGDIVEVYISCPVDDCGHMVQRITNVYGTYENKVYELVCVFCHQEYCVDSHGIISEDQP